MSASNQMKWETRIKKNGEVVTEVIERGQNCANIKIFTSQLGREMSDERTGPDCDEVHEVQQD